MFDWLEETLEIRNLLPAGVWATKLGQMAGVKVPLVAMHHAYVVTERIEGIQVRTCLFSTPIFFLFLKTAL